MRKQLGENDLFLCILPVQLQFVTHEAIREYSVRAAAEHGLTRRFVHTSTAETAWLRLRPHYLEIPIHAVASKSCQVGPIARIYTGIKIRSKAIAWCQASLLSDRMLTPCKWRPISSNRPDRNYHNHNCTAWKWNQMQRQDQHKERPTSQLEQLFSTRSHQTAPRTNCECGCSGSIVLNTTSNEVISSKTQPNPYPSFLAKLSHVELALVATELADDEHADCAFLKAVLVFVAAAEACGNECKETGASYMYIL